jgi:hypothetical protein
LLIAPMQLVIDSNRNLFGLQWKTIGAAKVFLAKDDIILRTRLFFWQKDWHPLQWKPAKKKPKKKKPAKKKKNWLSFRRVKRLLRSFRVKKLLINIDTDDYVVNSYLYPLFYLLDRSQESLHINYEGEFDCQLTVENRGYRILNALLF